MSTPDEKTPAKRAGAIPPDYLLPPQVPPNPSVVPVAAPNPVVLPPHLIPQAVPAQLPQPSAYPIPTAPVAQVPLAPIPVAQPATFQPLPPTYPQPVAPTPIPVAQPLVPLASPPATVPAAPVARAIPKAVPANPATAQPPLAKQPTAEPPTTTNEKRPATSKPQPDRNTSGRTVQQPRKQPSTSTAPREPVSAKRSPPQPQPATPLPDASEAPRETNKVRVPAPIVPDQEPSDGSVIASLLGGVPSWFVSSMLHVLAIILLSIFTLPRLSDNDKLFIEVAYAEEESLAGEELVELPTLDLPVAEPIVLQQLPEVSDPLAAMPILEPGFLGEVAPSEVQADAIGMALTGREKGMRKALVGKYGGTAATESSVEGGLAWLARNQQRDGSWSLKGPYSDGGPVENLAAATAMALLAFQGAGNTHLAGDYQEQVANGWKALLKLQKPNGDFYNGDVPNQQLYTHGQATIAVCELYGMTKDKAFRDPAARAVAYALQAQSPEGGWRYYPGQDADTSVTGWYVMALQSALMAGLEVPEENLLRIGKYLDSVQLDDGSRYVYQPLQQATPTMTAEGLLCRQYLGWKRDDSRLLSGVEYILSHPVDPAENYDVYYWYYAAQLTHHMEGNAWDRWNDTMRTVLPTLQVTKGKERGSWEPKPDRWSHLGGRLYVTCFSIYSLEVYYRHLPIYTYRE